MVSRWERDHKNGVLYLGFLIVGAFTPYGSVEPFVPLAEAGSVLAFNLLPAARFGRDGVGFDRQHYARGVGWTLTAYGLGAALHYLPSVVARGADLVSRL